MNALDTRTATRADLSADLIARAVKVTEITLGVGWGTMTELVMPNGLNVLISKDNVTATRTPRGKLTVDGVMHHTKYRKLRGAGARWHFERTGKSASSRTEKRCTLALYNAAIA